MFLSDEETQQQLAGLQVGKKADLPPPPPTFWHRALTETSIGKALGDAYKAFTLPGDVYAGRTPIRAPNPDTGAVEITPDVIERSTNLAGLLEAGAAASPVAPGGTTVGSGPVRTKRVAKPPSLLDEAPGVPVASAAPAPAPSSLFEPTDLSKVPDVPQFDLPRYTPPRGVPARVQELTSDPGVRDKVKEVVAQGRDMGGANWYNAEPLRAKFVQELGNDAGNQAFRQYMDFVAATSPRSNVGTNVRNASYYYSRQMKGEAMPEVGTSNPQPYGHIAQRLHQLNAQRVAGQGWDPLNNPKPASFVENLVGNQQPATIDTHAFRLPAMLKRDPRFLVTDYEASKGAPKQNIQRMVQDGLLTMDDAYKTPAYWAAQPKENEYRAMENFYKGIGEEMGLTPAQTQASAWVGGGKVTGLASDESKPFIGFFEERVMLTAQKLNMDPQDVLKRFVRGEMPLLGLTGPAAAAALPIAQQMLGQEPAPAARPES
jgi:hypothetical protein